MRTTLPGRNKAGKVPTLMLTKIFSKFSKLHWLKTKSEALRLGRVKKIDTFLREKDHARLRIEFRCHR